MFEREITWKLERYAADLDIPVWISVQKLDAEWRRQSDDYVGHGGSGRAKPGSYDGIGRWLQVNSEMSMPMLCFDEKGAISFTNGRHRFAWCRDHGVKSIQISVSPDEYDEFVRRFGTDIKESRCDK